MVAELAHAWFLGHNTHQTVMAAGGGCCDGLDDGGANPNMGAESTLAYVLSAGDMARLAPAAPARPLRLAR